MEYITLNNGIKMPIVGTGTNTYGKENNDYNGALTNEIPELVTALELGYRSIDAAISYRNEELVGGILAESTVPREELFITTKIPAREEYVSSKESTRAAIDNSLKNFRTDYLDLLLIHAPIEDKEQFKNTWEVFEEYYEAGKLKAIGVSNFRKNHLDELKEFAKVKPAVNQIQINLKEKNEDLLALLKDEGITPVAWGPMKTEAHQEEVLDEIGKAYDKSGAQVLLKYQIERGVVVIPKSHNRENQAANLDLFDFELTDADVEKIENL
ncbi:diketogulonate reductase-like aldo/keto reductase [Solibacillus kalamii]|uniref:Aldo/keto reductase n=1 Tax=Solibacillus kalamii TaxID=1748298 RepID=A0ABX3ZG93_9BACL|nr:aldo/keto reductase [Solibacillus kalamii]MBM7665841.1 diketogulonate reductase-like aldo/keto reductase [Solibacillus kalamii]OUZ38721.1 aldo/keto reductase [Solibacillus kalamii]